MANNTLIGAIRAEATLEGGKFVSGAKKIQQSAKQTESQLKKSFGVMGAAAKGFGLSLATGLSVGLLTNAIKKALDYAGSLGEISQQLGVTTRDLQVFRFAAGQLGVKQEQLETGLSKLTITLGKVAAGAKAPADALRAIGISAEQLKGKDTGEAFRLIADGLQKVTDRSQRAAVEVALFGKSGAMLDNLLAGGSTAINELALAAEKLGIVLSDEQIRKADETADKLDALKTVLSAQIAGVVADNADAILAFANALAELGSEAADVARKVAAFYRTIAIESARFVASHPDASRVLFGTKGSEVILRAGAGAIRSNIADKNPPKPRARVAGGGDIDQFLAGGGRKGGGRSRKAPRDTSARDAFQFEEEQRRADLDILRAKQDLAHDYVERTALAIQMLDLEKQGFEAELRYQVAAGEKTQAQADSLKLKNDEVDHLKRMQILEQEEEARQRDYNALDQRDAEAKLELLQMESRLAETASERRAIELRILDLAYEEERRRLERIIAESKDWAEIEAARRDLLDLSRKQSLDRQGVIQGTRGPMEDWLASLPTTAAKAQEAMEQLQVQGFEGLIDAAVALTEGFDSAKDALLSTLKQFLQGLLRMQLQQGLGSLLGKGGINLGSIFGGFGGGSTSTGGMSASSPSFVGPRFAGGGSFTVKGMQGIDRNTLMLNGIPIANVSYGERVSVSNDNLGSSGARITNQSFNFPNSDFDSFRRNQSQVSRVARRRLGV